MVDDRIELSGFHAVKHALRFGAEDLEVWTDDRPRAMALCRRLAPDLEDRVDDLLVAVTTDAFVALGEYAHHTHVVGRARRPSHDLGALDARSERPVVHLERPVDPGNVGAVIRVAAGVGAAGVTVGGFDQLWSPACVRGSAGLHFALPVLDAQVGEIPGGRAIVAFDPEGSGFDPGVVDPGSVLVFGSERDGLDQELLSSADSVVRLPMIDGVSSLNLATAVAAATYALALGA